MSTLSEITYSILDTIKPNNLSGNDITTELIAYHIKNVRAQLIKQSMGKSYSLHNSYIQSLGCIKLVAADASECCEYPTGCIIMRTEVEIPSVVDCNTNLLTRVGTVNISEKSFQNIQFERVPYLNNKYTNNIIKWFTINNSNYVYFVMNDDYMKMGMEVVNIQGVFEDPELVGNFTNCLTGLKCFNSDSKYPIPESTVPILQEIVIKKFLAITVQQPIDKSNDNNENFKPAGN